MNKKSNYIDYVTYIDTDSVVGETMINVNSIDMSIEEYYNKQKNYILEDTFNEKYVKECSDDVTFSMADDGSVNTNEIKYVMKHMVEKEMFKIEVNGKSVIVTEDHSIIVKRNGKYITASPKNIQKNDELINI